MIVKNILNIVQKILFSSYTNSSPENGELWGDGTDICTRAGGVTRKLTATQTAHGVLIGNGLAEPTVTGAGTAGHVLTSNGASSDPTFQAASAGSVSAVTHTVAQTSHGLTVGDVIRISSTNTYTTAVQGTNESSATAVGIVTVVTDANNFEFVSAGEITTGVPSGAAGTSYWLSTGAGNMTSTKPTTLGNYITPILEIVETSVKAIVNIQPPYLNALKVLTGSATLNFASTASLGTTDLTITVTGAATGDQVSLGLPATPSAGTYTAWVSATNTVKVRFSNHTGATVDPGSATFTAIVFQTP